MAKSIITKICAGILPALSLSPVTAPFSTFDLAVLLGHASTDSALPVRTPSHAASAPADASVSVMPSSRIARINRVKLVMVADGHPATAALCMPDASRGRAEGSAVPLAPVFSLTTNLRL
jgi:hypothetical protein